MKIIKLMQEYVGLQSIAADAIDEGVLSDENIKSVKEFLSFLDQDVEIVKTEEVKPTSYSASMKMIEVSKASDIEIKPKKHKIHKKAFNSGRKTKLQVLLDEHPELKVFDVKYILKKIPYYKKDDRNKQRLDKIIAEMITAHKLCQVSKNSFRVIR